MTVAVMTRATLGHTGQALQAGYATQAAYALLLAAALVRIVAAFILFVLLYGPLLAMRKPGWDETRR
jgi:uncharacterized protein involved in response to NO